MTPSSKNLIVFTLLVLIKEIQYSDSVGAFPSSLVVTSLIYKKTNLFKIGYGLI